MTAADTDARAREIELTPTMLSALLLADAAPTVVVGNGYGTAFSARTARHLANRELLIVSKRTGTITALGRAVARVLAEGTVGK